MSENGFSDLEIRALEVFVTSATDQIYACKADLPPEVFGAFGSFFSRNPKDLRSHLLDAILGRTKDHEAENPEQAQRNLERLAKGEFESPIKALESGVAKSQSFFTKWYGNYSHKSIANTVWIPFVGTNVSQLFARHLAYDQLAFFIEQSTRFVQFDVDNLYLDESLMKSSHADLFRGTLDKAAKAYERFTEAAADHYGKSLTFDKWEEKQTDAVLRKGEDFQRRKWRRELRAKSFDVARLLLPQAVRTNIAWILDARSTEFDVAAWKGHPLNEMREASMLIEKAGGKIAPSLLRYTERNPYYAEQYEGFGGALDIDLEPQHMSKGVDVISHEPDSLDKVLAILMMRNNRSGDFRRFHNHARGLSFKEKINALKNITRNRGERDEWVDVEEAFDCLGVTLQIRTDVGATRDLRRHQKWDRNEGLYTLDNGFYLPEVVEEMGAEALKAYKEVMDTAYEAEKVIRKDFPNEVQYIIPMAAMHTITMRGGFDQWQYFVATRTVPQGHFSYREDAFNIAEAVCKVHPWLLGLEEYPSDGRNIQKVYEDDSVLKNLLRMYIGDTGLHT